MKFGSDDAGHIVIAGQYSKRDGVYQSARAYSAQALDGNLKPTGSSNATPTVIDINSGRYRSTTAAKPAGRIISFLITSLIISTPPITCRCRWKRYNVTALGSYKSPMRPKLYARGSYTRSDVTAILAPTATGGFNFAISPSNPFLNATKLGPDLRRSGQSERRRHGQCGYPAPRHRDGRSASSNSPTTPISGSSACAATSPTASITTCFAQYGLAKRHEALLNDLDYNRTAQAINATVGANGTPVCVNPSNGCVPVNLFTSQPISSAALSFITANGSQDNRYTQFVTGGSLSGDLNFCKAAG